MSTRPPSLVRADRDIYSVGRLNREVRMLLDHGLPLLWVEGEISNFSRPASGHWYFSLKDRDAQVRCAMFRQRNSLVRFTPAEGKLVLLDFTGSDFCSSCIRLHKEVFPAKEFAAFAKQRLILVEVDFPLKKKQPAALKAANEALSKEFKVDGYPTLILLGSDGKKLGEVEFDLFDASAKDVIAAIEKLAKPAKP